MTLDSTGGVVLMAGLAVVFFAAVIGVVVWIYSRQSTGRRVGQTETNGASAMKETGEE